MDATEITSLVVRLSRERMDLRVELERRLQRAERLADELHVIEDEIPELERRLAAFTAPVGVTSITT